MNNKLPLTNDYVFKRVFAYEGNEEILKDFLEAILKIEIKTLEVKNPEIVKNFKKDKLGILDIKVEVENNKIIDIEMQVENEYNMEERSTTYLGKLIASQIKAGELYTNLKKTIVICILNFNYIKRNSYHHIGKMKFEKYTQEEYIDMGIKNEEEIASKYMEIHFIELPKFKKKNPNTKARLNQWLWLLAGEEEKIKMAEKENEKVKQAVKTLEQISSNPEERERYESIVQAEFNKSISNQKFLEQGIKRGIKRGIKQGIEQGEKRKQIEIAKNMKKEGIDIKIIQKITKLKKEEINSL